MDKKKNGGFVPSESDLGLPEPGDIESVKGSEPTTVESPKTTAASPAKAKKTAPQVTKKATPQAEKKAASQAPKKAAPPAKAKKAAPPAKAKKAGNGRSALADEMKVCAAVDARKGTIREKLQAFCKTPITVAALVEKAKGVRNVRGKVRSMLKKGTLKQA